MTNAMGSSPKYPNQQLRSVSLETYFPGELRALATLGEIQEALRTSLPHLFVPNIQPGEAIALRPYQLRDDNQTKSLALAVNQASFVSFAYPGYEAFSREAIPIVASALTRLKPSKLNRVVYRYENEIGLARDAEGSLGVERIFPAIFPQIFLGGTLAGNSKAIDSAVEHAWESEEFRGVRGFHARTEDVGASLIFKIMVFGAVEGCSVSDLAQATETAHRVGVNLFESLISPAFRKFISADAQGEDGDAS